MALVAGFVLVWILSGFILKAFQSGEILDGTSVSGVELGGQTRAGAAKLIGEIEPRSIRLRSPDQTFTVRAPQAGLLIDDAGSAERAYSAGRSGLGSILSGPLFLFSDREVEPVFAPLNERRLTRTIKRVSDEVDRDPFVGALTIEPGTLDVSTEQPEDGVMVRRNLLKERLPEAIRSDEATLRIPTRTEPAPTLAQVEAIASEAEDYLRESVRIGTAGGPATFTPEQIAPLLAVESTDGAIRLGTDREEVEKLVASFAEDRDVPARDAGLDAPPQPPTTLTTQGDLTWQPKEGAASVTPARTGREIVQRAAVRNLTRAIRNDRHQVRFPTELVKPTVSTKEMRGATSLLGTFTTNYSCCEPRVTNIQQMAKTVDGTVIAPGEQFSLNGITGERTRAKGYKNAPTIGEGNKLVDSVGGGVSQFSTTLYNAAYFAGLQIDAHTPHSFYIDRYPPGRESTLNYGSIDLLWTNDTGAPVVVRSSAGDTSVTVSLYGDNGGRKVRADTRSRSKNSLGGFDITIDRIVVNPDGSREREPFTTTYGLPGD